MSNGKKNVYGGIEIYKRKHGHAPNQPPYSTDQDVIDTLRKIKNEK